MRRNKHVYAYAMLAVLLPRCAAHQLPPTAPSKLNASKPSSAYSGDAPVAPMCLPDIAVYIQDRMEFVVADSRLDPDVIAIVQDAVGWWNDRLGAKHLLWAGVAHIPDYELDLPYIGVRYATEAEVAGYSPTQGGLALRHIDPELRCIDGTLIQIRNRTRSEMAARWLVYHEIGHALGLSHSSEIMSIMYPSATKEPWWCFEVGEDTARAISQVLYPL